jgi:aerobic carbon-monoxide dehydrogenase medium subunit
MIPPPFEYRVPSSLHEALTLLREYGDEARVMAGGQSLLPMLKLRLIRPRVIVDLARLSELSYVRDEEEWLQIGALVTERTLERSAVLEKSHPLLAEAATSIGDIHIRNLGTIGGTLSQADPSGDLAPAALALQANFVVQSMDSTRTVPANDFFEGPFTTRLAEDEVLTRVDLPRFRGAAEGSSYIKLTRRAGDYAVVGAATFVSADQNGKCDACRIGLCAVGPRPFLCEEASGALLNTELTDADLAEAAQLGTKEASPSTDVHASAEYRAQMIPVVVLRALEKARERLRRKVMSRS